MDLELQGKSVIVTGASKGIGLAVAETFAAEGATPVLVSRTGEALQVAAQQIRHTHSRSIPRCRSPRIASAAA